MNKLNALTSLRFFAAVAIVIEHTKDAFHATAWIHSPVPYDYGVSMFFVLSGFILSYNYRSIDSLAETYRFYVARFARIWPLHIAALLLNMALIPISARYVNGDTSHWVRITTANVFLVQSWIPEAAYFFSLNAVSWSVSTELFFYLMFPVLRHNWSKTWHWKSVAVIAASCSVLAIASAVNVAPLDFKEAMRVSNTGIAYISPFVRIIEFVIGMLAASVYAKLSQFCRGGVMIWTALEAATFFLIPFMWNHTQNLANKIAGHDVSLGVWNGFLAHSGAAPAFAIIIVVMALGRGLISKALSLRPLVLLGEASFAMYLIHQTLIGFFYLNRPKFDAFPDLALCIGYWALTIAASFALWQFVEKPCRRIIRASLESRPKATTSPDPA